MKYSPRIEHAIRVAAEYHDGQRRHDIVQLPYISHPFTVAVLVANHTDDEDVIIAALLHDLIEDTHMTEEKLEILFGPRVKEFVTGVTEPTQDVTWKEQKEIYIEKLRTGSIESLLIATADKIHNMQTKFRLAEEFGTDYLFSTGLLDEKYLWYHGTVGEIVEKRLPHKELKELYQETFIREQRLLAA